MFNKILSNLAFNPNNLQLLKEYQRAELKQRALRGFGFSFVMLAFIVQLFAFAAPSGSQAAASPNDLIPGGVNSKSQLVSRCNSNYHQVKTIYAWYGVSCKDIANGVFKELKSTEYNDTLWSVGHLPYGIAGETPVSVAGSTLYWRKLHGWDTGKYSTYKATKVISDNGKVFFILWPCGNLVSVGFPKHYVPPTPPKKKKTPPPQLCQYNSNLPASSPLCKPCTASTTAFDTASCLSFSKAASNLTQHISNANNTTANAGDSIQYTLTVKNSGKAASKDFIIQENISDVLDYAAVTNPGGGMVGSGGIITWPATTIPANGQVQKQFTVQVKNPVPTTPAGADDPQGFNSVMTNVYGNTININVKQPTVVTAVAATTTALPNTGPGTGVIVMALVTVVVGYFYFRSRLLVKEADIVMDFEAGKGKQQ